MRAITSCRSYGCCCICLNAILLVPRDVIAVRQRRQKRHFALFAFGQIAIITECAHITRPSGFLGSPVGIIDCAARRGRYLHAATRRGHLARLPTTFLVASLLHSRGHVPIQFRPQRERKRRRWERAAGEQIVCSIEVRSQLEWRARAPLLDQNWIFRINLIKFLGQSIAVLEQLLYLVGEHSEHVRRDWIPQHIQLSLQQLQLPSLVDHQCVQSMLLLALLSHYRRLCFQGRLHAEPERLGVRCWGH